MFHGQGDCIYAHNLLLIKKSHKVIAFINNGWQPHGKSFAHRGQFAIDCERVVEILLVDNRIPILTRPMLTGKIMNIMVKWMPLKIPVLQKTHITKIINNKYNSK